VVEAHRAGSGIGGSATSDRRILAAAAMRSPHPCTQSASPAAAGLGVSAFSSIDYSQTEIDEKLQGRFSRYYEHFLAPGPGRWATRWCSSASSTPSEPSPPCQHWCRGGLFPVPGYQ